MVDCIRFAARGEGSECRAKTLDARQRRELALAGLAGTHSITDLARQHQVSRRFVSRQVGRAAQALDDVFVPAATASEKVLGWVAITPSWLRQFTLAMILCGHSSYRGVQEVADDLLGVSLSLGTIHNVVRQAAATARELNAQVDLANIHVGAHDEIFQHGCPVLAGVDVASTYCYLLSLETQRDAETWGFRLLELQDQGLTPRATIADGGRGLRAGQALAWPDVPCRGDVFHALREVGQVVTYLENRAWGAWTALEQQERRMQRAKRHGRGRCESQRLAAARVAATQAVRLADDVALLSQWLREDVLAVAGPTHATRQELFDWILAELESRQTACPHRLQPLVRLLRNQRDELLAFAVELDHSLAAVAAEFQLAPDVVRALLAVLEPATPQQWQAEAALRSRLGRRFPALRAAVADVACHVVRASSVIENLNSRLRQYFFLRRHLGPEYLELLQFFLNHRRFLRSEHPERTGRSPCELLTGTPHAHWLELLGYERSAQG